MPRVKTDEKLDEILEAASRVFAEKDFHQVLIDEIAEAGGIGKGTVYRYFRTKEDLYFATILRGLDRLHALFRPPCRRKSRRRGASSGSPARCSPSSGTSAPVEAALPRRAPSFGAAWRAARASRSDHGPRPEGDPVEGSSGGSSAAWIPTSPPRAFLGMIRGINIFRRDDDTIDDLVAEIVGLFTRGIAEGVMTVESPLCGTVGGGRCPLGLALVLAPAGCKHMQPERAISSAVSPAPAMPWSPPRRPHARARPPPKPAIPRGVPEARQRRSRSRRSSTWRCATTR